MTSWERIWRQSHPTRVRGLKPRQQVRRPLPPESHPTRVRGLKPLPSWTIPRGWSVAPHAGAWIETGTMDVMVTDGDLVAPHAGAWIETGEGLPDPRWG